MLEYPINIKKKDLKMAKLLNDQLGGPHGELGACLRYLCQRFTMPDEKEEVYFQILDVKKFLTVK